MLWPMTADLSFRVRFCGTNWCACAERALSQYDVAHELGWPPSTLIRMEGGRSPIATAELDALLTRFGVNSEAERERLLDLSQGASAAGWWEDYRSKVPGPYLDYVGYEAGTVFIRQFPGTVIPGLLQTAEYAEALTAPAVDPVQVGAVVDVRLQRRAELMQRSSRPGNTTFSMRASFTVMLELTETPVSCPISFNTLLTRPSETNTLLCVSSLSTPASMPGSVGHLRYWSSTMACPICFTSIRAEESWRRSPETIQTWPNTPTNLNHCWISPFRKTGHLNSSRFSPRRCCNAISGY